MTDTQNKIKAAQKKYDDLAAKAAASAKDDKKFRAGLDAEMKQKLKGRFGDIEKIVKDKGDAHRELVALKEAREGEIVAGVDKGSIKADAAKAELISLGHTPDSADIQLARALKKPASNVAPAPLSAMPTAPLPVREAAPTPSTAAPTNVVDPISAKVPESQEVNYKDSALKTQG